MSAAHRKAVSFMELLVVAGKAGLLALYLLALVAGLRRHDALQTFILLTPVALGAAWQYRAQLVQLMHLDHPNSNTEPEEGN